MKYLKDFDFESEVNEMVDEFGGYQDTNAVCNLKVGDRTIQVVISLIDSEDSDFIDYEGIPTFIH